MSTDYALIKTSNGESVCLGEHSNLLDVYIENDGVDDVSCAKNLTPAQIVTMALNALKVASYWMDSDEFTEALKSYVRGTGRGSYEAGMMRDIGRAAEDVKKE
jgi:hypothetical protein